MVRYMAGIMACTAGLMLWTMGAKAQEGKVEDPRILDIALHAKSFGDSVVLRWAPKDAAAWSMCRKKGYQLLRIGLKKNGILDSVQLNKQPILPMSLERMKTVASPDDKYMAIAAQAMYGKNFSMTNPGQQPRTLVEQIQQANDMFTMRFYFALQAADLSKTASEALGLRWVDRDVELGKMYTYIVTSDTTDANYTVSGGATMIINGKQDISITPDGLKGFAYDHRIELQWQRNQIGGFTTYYIERSDDGGQTYKRLNKEPFQAIYNSDSEKSTDSVERKVSSILAHSHVFMDSIPQNYHDYYYRIAGIDAFADLSEFSAPIQIHGIDLTPPRAAGIDSVVNIFQNHLLVHWNDPAQKGDFAGYFVNRGDNAAGPFYPLHQEMLSKNTRSFLDTTANALQQNYYVVVSVDTAHNVSYSVPYVGILTDSIAPLAPQAVLGTMDSVGYVALYWDKNQEPDLAGYRIYSSYLEDGEYGIVSRNLVRDNFFLDSISTQSLDRKVYYKIVAVDKNGNHSLFSKAGVIKKPILIPPTAPVNKQIYTEGNAVHTEWIGSQSEGVWGYEVYRREKETASWDTIAYIPSEQSIDFVWVDSTIQANIKYSYAASTVDSTGLRSEISFPVWTMHYDSHTLPQPQGLSAQYLSDGHAVAISWNADHIGEDCFYILYRAEGDGVLRMLTSVDKGETFFNDRGIKKGIAYRYVIEVRQSGGIQRSEKSKEVSITIP